jgi:hypothetical protein
VAQQRIARLSLAVAGLALAWLIVETRAARQELGRIDERQRLALDWDRGITVDLKERTVTTYNSTIDCCGSPLTITTTGTITEHLAAVKAAKKECATTCE